MKIYLNNPNEGWVVDRFRSEFYANYPQATENILEADVVWIIAPWTWRSIRPSILENKKVVCTIHHIVPEKFDLNKLRDFQMRDRYVDLYHVPSNKTLKQISKITNKNIWSNPFWVNEQIWQSKTKQQKIELRSKYNFPSNAYLIGSFQRDTEGHDLKTPKLEKGPDIFCDSVIQIKKNKPNLEVVLAGWRRQYVISRLQRANIKYHYFELPSFDIINELYNCLDLYIVGSRHEGGPQSIFECACINTPIVSTDVGAATEILHEKSIFKPGMIEQAMGYVEHANDSVQKYMIKSGAIQSFIDTFSRL
jgi:glycosyltransferase involved in cell wall biosynthesis